MLMSCGPLFVGHRLRRCDGLNSALTIVGAADRVGIANCFHHGPLLKGCVAKMMMGGQHCDAVSREWVFARLL